MKMNLIKSFLIILMISSKFSYAGSVIEVPAPVPSDMVSNATKTFLWPAQEPVATLVFIQGGMGRLALRDDQTNLNHPFYQMLRRLAETKNGDEKINVVVFDNPWAMGEIGYPSMRGQKNHLKRIEDVVIFYKEKYGLPVWIMGHSNGGVSAASFVEYLQEKNSLELIKGAIFSNAYNYIPIKAPIKLPILIVQHKYDACDTTNARAKESIFEEIKKVNQSVTELEIITSGGSAGDCKSGAHMYSDSELDARKSIKRFILKNTRASKN